MHNTCQEVVTDQHSNQLPRDSLAVLELMRVKVPYQQQSLSAVVPTQGGGGGLTA